MTGNPITTTELTTTEMTPTKLTSEEAEDRAYIAIQRWRANMLNFPHLCVKAVCRRAGKCSADPDICMGRFAPLVSEEVRAGVNELFFGKLDGLSFDEV